MTTPGHSILTKSQTRSTGFRSLLNFPALKKCRLADKSDICALQLLMTNEVIDTFRGDQLQHVIYTSAMPMIWENVTNELALFVCFDTGPQIPAISHDMWERFIHLHFGLEHLSYENTWFLTMIILDPRYTRYGYFEQILRGVFLRHPKKRFFVVYVPPNAHPHYLFPILKKFFKRYYPKDARTPGSPKLYVCSRDKYFPRCIVRRAMPADNDDLMEMLDQRCSDLRNIYGDYVIAELAMKTNSERQILVIEHKNRPEGMMCLNDSPDCSLMEALKGSELESIVCANGFFIELAAFAEDWDEYSAYDLLLGAFELYPTKEYCVMGLPSDVRAYKYLKTFSKLAPARNRQVPQEVYVLQKDIYFSAFSVRGLSTDAFDSLILFLEDLVSPHLVVEAVMESSDHDHSYVLTLEKRIVGFFMTEDLSNEEFEHLAANFDLQDYFGQYGLIKLAIISPAFSALWGFFVRQVCGFNNFTGLFYTVANKIPEDVRLTCSFLAYMRPIRPRLLSMSNSVDFGLCHTSKRQTVQQKHDVNLKIVVAGGGRTAWSFLETLIFKNTWFTNLTLINPNGIDDGSNIPTLFPFCGSHGLEHMQRIQLPVWVNVINGKVTGVDQISKRVIIDDGQILDYDVLYLFYGVQYEMPESLLPISAIWPKNFVVINTRADAEKTLVRMKQVINDDPRSAKFIIQGLNLDSLSILRNFMDSGIPGEYFTILTTTNDEFYTFDEFIQNFLEHQLEKLRVQIFHKAEIQEFGVDAQRLQVILKSGEHGLSMKAECTLFVYFEKKVVTKETRTTIINSGLGFDGRMIVDLYGKACDANIYGAGPFTKFKRMYYAERFRHELYSSEEIGRTMADELMDNLSRKEESDAPGAKVKFDAMRRQQDPLVDYCILPGSIYLLMIRPPGRQALNQGGKNLVTNNGTPIDPRYFRVHLNAQNVIDSLVCLSGQPIDHRIYVKLYGKIESLLDHMLARFNDKKISDFFDYFSQSWMSAIYHDRYCQVDHQNSELVEQQKELCPLSQPMYDHIDQNLMMFLVNHKNELPMYATSVGTQLC